MSTIEQATRDPVPVSPGAEALTGDKARAGRVALDRRRRRQLQIVGIRVASLVIVLSLWQVFGAHVDPVLFTVPSKIFVAAVDMIGSGELWMYLWPSLIVLGIGLALAVVFGIAIGLLLARFWFLDVALGVYLTFLYSIPSVALVPLIVLWAGFEMTAKVIILFLFAFFPMAINTYQGVKAVDPKLLEVGRAFRCSERQLWINSFACGSQGGSLESARSSQSWRTLLRMIFRSEKNVACAMY